jgi:hypothetical protein
MGNVIDHFHSYRTGASQDGRVVVTVDIAKPFVGNNLLGVLFRFSDVSTKNNDIRTESLQTKETGRKSHRVSVFQISTYL